MTFVLDAIEKDYGSGSTRTIALAGVSLAARPAEFVSIVGPSGCGKTTLLKILAGLVTPSAGTVTFSDATPDKLQTALVFQDHGLLPWYDVLENVALGLRFQNVPRATALARARHFIEQVGLGKFQHHRPHELSIGMRQRVGIARAFVADPAILLLDEPFGSLDAQTRLVLQQELLRIWQEHRRVVVHVTHDIDEAILLSDRIVVMSGRPGTIRAELPVVFARPRTFEVLASAEAVALRQRIWSLLELEVRESLAVPT
ncbi:MAG TPA: ABC transporter ATP-binding protein [Thermoanaerobaculia bacterium]